MAGDIASDMLDLILAHPDFATSRPQSPKREIIFERYDVVEDAYLLDGEWHSHFALCDAGISPRVKT